MKQAQLPLLCFIIVTIFGGCSKKPTVRPNHNQIVATVLLSSGQTVTVTGNGTSAIMGCSSFGGGSYIDATDPVNGKVYLNIHNNFSCITAPGTYTYQCQYRKAVGPNEAIYQNQAGKGSITYATASNNLIEGSFAAVCKCVSPECVAGDSVIVSGTFRGDFFY
jgi:hypothetical protein